MSPDVALPQFNVLGHRQRLVEVSLSSGNYSRLLADVLFTRSMGYYMIQVRSMGYNMIQVRSMGYYMIQVRKPGLSRMHATKRLRKVNGHNIDPPGDLLSSLF